MSDHRTPEIPGWLILLLIVGAILAAHTIDHDSRTHGSRLPPMVCDGGK